MLKLLLLLDLFIFIGRFYENVGEVSRGYKVRVHGFFPSENPAHSFYAHELFF